MKLLTILLAPIALVLGLMVAPTSAAAPAPNDCMSLSEWVKVEDKSPGASTFQEVAIIAGSASDPYGGRPYQMAGTDAPFYWRYYVGCNGWVGSQGSYALVRFQNTADNGHRTREKVWCQDYPTKVARDPYRFPDGAVPLLGWSCFDGGAS